MRSWAAWLVMAIGLLALPATRFIAIPLCLTLGALCALYGRTLTRELDDAPPWPRTTMTLVYVLLAFAVFWDVERVARATGEAFADHIVGYPQQLVAVDVYSEKRLEISAPGIVESELDPDSAYTFRYTGLRLLEGTRDRMVLLNDGGSHVIVLRDGDGLRFEFTKD